MKLSSRGIAIAVLLVALLGSAYFFVFAKANQRRAELLADTRQKRSALENLRQATAGIDDVNHKLDDLKKAIAFFENKLPQEKEMDKILKQVWQMAEANALQCKTIKTLKSEKSANYSEQPIELSLSGNFDGYYSFLLQLEKLQRLTRVTQMHLEKMNDTEGAMTAQMTMSIFFEPETGTTATASAQ